MTTNIIDLLKRMYEVDASDLIVKVGSPPLFRIYGDLIPLEGAGKLVPQDTARIASEVATSEEWARFEQDMELDFAYTVPGMCRFRVNLFLQRGSVGLVFRLIPNKVRTIEELNLPQTATSLSLRPRGLVLVTGPAGSGKSTTQAAMVDHRNAHEECHIMTVEDPIEYIHRDKKALVNQRQVGRDTLTFANALKYVLRQDPDVILIGEMRDLETIALAITAAETGHLALGTLHTTDAVGTIDRIIDVFPMYQQQQIRMQMSVNLIGVISQVLLKRADGKGRVAAYELMVATNAVRNMIREAKTYQLPQLLETGTSQGMQSMNHSIAALVKSGLVAAEEALLRSPNPNELRQMIGPVQTQPAAARR
ncbi:MAG: type IV pilus twitching motility protein PilT [Actinobacteria bacterium]|nr:MAG: type IV pilus twitching motility protein PilT [Actinomycetota bacterium]